MEIFPCTAAATNDSTVCDRDSGQFFTADASGAFRQTFAVHQILQMGDGSAVDCNDTPRACVLWVGVPGNAAIATKVALTFAAHGPTPVVTARSRSITEPTGTNHPTAIDFVLSEPTDHVVRVHWQDDAYGGTADVNADYIGVHNGVVDIFPGQTRATTFLDVVGDRIDEPDEWLPITLFSPAGATVGPDARLTIRDDDPPPTARLDDSSVKEQNAVRFAQVPVRLSAASGFPVSVRFTTHQFTARAGSDYVETTGTLTIPAGETMGNIAVVILGDRIHESTETLLVTIDTPQHTTIADGDAVLTITDDD
jgi:chitinase